MTPSSLSPASRFQPALSGVGEFKPKRLERSPNSLTSLERKRPIGPYGAEVLCGGVLPIETGIERIRPQVECATSARVVHLPLPVSGLHPPQPQECSLPDWAPAQALAKGQLTCFGAEDDLYESWQGMSW